MRRPAWKGSLGSLPWEGPLRGLLKSSPEAWKAVRGAMKVLECSLKSLLKGLKRPLENVFVGGNLSKSFSGGMSRFSRGPFRVGFSGPFKTFQGGIFQGGLPRRDLSPGKGFEGAFQGAFQGFFRGGIFQGVFQGGPFRGLERDAQVRRCRRESQKRLYSFLRL